MGGTLTTAHAHAHVRSSVDKMADRLRSYLLTWFIASKRAYDLPLTLKRSYEGQVVLRIPLISDSTNYKTIKAWFLVHYWIYPHELPVKSQKIEHSTFSLVLYFSRLNGKLMQINPIQHSDPCFKRHITTNSLVCAQVCLNNVITKMIAQFWSIQAQLFGFI